MKWILFLLVFSASGFSAGAQTLEWIDRQEHFQATTGQTVRIPIKIKNTTDKVQFFIVKKASGDIGSNQKGYFCLGDDCLDPGVDQFSKKLEPGETITNLYFTVEPGMVTTSNSFRFEVYSRNNPTIGIEHSVSLSVDEKTAKSLVFQSRDITVHDIYPNPINDQAFIDYKLHNELIKAKVVIHNILGSPVGHYDLSVFESRAKIQADELTSGVYFYTVYIDNIGVLTRKLIVRK